MSYNDTLRAALHAAGSPTVFSPNEAADNRDAEKAGITPEVRAAVILATRAALPPTTGIHIAGRRWFQRTYGNTYHTATVHLPDDRTLRSPRTYGYGDSYLDTAWELLRAEGLVQGRSGGSLVLRERYGITWSCSDVARERDL